MGKFKSLGCRAKAGYGRYPLPAGAFEVLGGIAYAAFPPVKPAEPVRRVYVSSARKDTAIGLVTAGFISLAFMGFKGLG